ncbi:hypothetical protein E1B28_002936 [Marasmius oreades]|uniref:Uncharacterized protein n=1 Tax=Marasmius oreades TaxID=181124 RepID=A0A9P7RLI4_9AGAR|nr:uncharacterized protein E1B28_002936 [Marasmius oreades]KAG7085373.1 hypothetical protein E1B28_002936 [Marasmius oreades]
MKILSEHPEWGGEGRRITVKSLQQLGSEVTAKHNHINPKSIHGDSQVSSVHLEACWKAGHQTATEHLKKAGLYPPFDDMDAVGGYDILCPFGGGKMVLAEGQLADSEVEEPNEDGEDNNSRSDESLQPSDLEPDLEDHAGYEAEQNGEKKVNAWISIDGSEKTAHKATILCIFGDPFSPFNSKKRLKRVMTTRGFGQYRDGRLSEQCEDQLEEGKMIQSEDPALTVVGCEDQVFVAVVKIMEVVQSGSSLRSLPMRFLHEPNTVLHCHIMALTLVDEEYQPTGNDWHWNGNFVPGGVIRNIPGCAVDLINPDLECSTKVKVLTETFAFQTQELVALGMVICEHISQNLPTIPVIQVTKNFLYRTSSGDACLMCETSENRSRTLQNGRRFCLYCSVCLSDLTVP